MDDELLDWDAFKRFDKQGSVTHIPKDSVTLSKHGHLNLAAFSPRFAENPYVEILAQPTALLLVPSDSVLDYTVSRRLSKSGSVSVQKLMKEFALRQGLYPARWVEGKGLVVDIRPRRSLRPRAPLSVGQPDEPEDKDSLAGVLG